MQLGIDMDPSDNIQGIPVLDVNAEEKPWRKAGADISDYFNYGFDERTWNAYYKKQAMLCAANGKPYTKTRVQKRHTRHEETGPCFSYSSSGILASRESSASIDLTGGQPGSSNRVEGSNYLIDEGNNTQVVIEMFPEEGGITSYHLNPASNFSSLTCTAPSPLHYRPGRPPLSLDSGHAKEFDEPSSSSGVSSLIPGGRACSAGVINTAKAWECVARCDKDRDRPREHGHDKDSKRQSEICSSSHNRGEERMRHRDTMERGHRRHSFERVSGEEAGQQTERRWKSKGCRSRREDGEDRDRQSRHKRKKAERNKKDKETDKMSSADPERKLKSD
ncbi:pre-mRNA 3'-end-processing factor FIP1 isoform X2 [Trachinotus anak]|uniref:pre-mRNA 3'-end-processing factor FIP1 isoform X2 n=1 Tax=Trachinotus anak TaxID=443729 RepID=UPI0039F1C66B